MQKTLLQQIDRAKELLKTVRHASMATVNSDGSPHNTPLVLIHDQTLERVYWSSHPDSEHSKNIIRTGQIFVVLYDAVERGGLYIKAADAHPLEAAELETALAIYNKIRVSRGQDALPLSYYIGTSPQRMWSAKITQLWVNGTKRDQNDRVVQDIRTEIYPKDLAA